jgi:phosphoribosylaminoimidazole-succinocarboxamide synthase
MSNVLVKTDLKIQGLNKKYTGKVRDVYKLKNNLLVIVVTDRISAFDVVLPKGIPYKGQILNQIANNMLSMTEDIVPNWLLATPDPNVSVGKICRPFKIEMVIRGYLTGHAARLYKSGHRKICGINLPDGMKENDKFERPIITPSTKADKGSHDEDISKEEIIIRGIVSKSDYEALEIYTKKLFERGTAIAKKQGLILVDTKYEFGKTTEGEIVLIDEIHTPDSSRYFYEKGYSQRQDKGESQRQLSKEFVREWLIDNNFQGLPGQKLPKMNANFVSSVSKRYIELYEKIMGKSFIKNSSPDILNRVQKNLNDYLENL